MIEFITKNKTINSGLMADGANFVLANIPYSKKPQFDFHFTKSPCATIANSIRLDTMSFVYIEDEIPVRPATFQIVEVEK